MTEWDKLWKEENMVVWTYNDDANTWMAWLDSVKAEGDKLQEKADKWDKTIIQQLNPTYEELFNKLESLRTIIERYSEEPIYTRDIISFTNTMAEIKAVLEK